MTSFRKVKTSSTSTTAVTPFHRLVCCRSEATTTTRQTTTTRPTWIPLWWETEPWKSKAAQKRDQVIFTTLQEHLNNFECKNNVTFITWMDLKIYFTTSRQFSSNNVKKISNQKENRSNLLKNWWVFTDLIANCFLVY